jgi:hypothetical protein
MLGKNWINKSFTFLTALAVLCMYSTVSLAAQNDVKGELTVTGQVTVNGQPAVSNSTVVSGSTITTGTNSSAVISLSKNGRVELLPETSITLKYSENSIVAMLSSGKVRVSNSAGISATVTTKGATVVADTGQANVFAVDIGCGDTAKCAQTYVETTTGLVTLRSGNTTKQVAAGTDATAGVSQTGCKPCYRPGSAPPPAIAGIGAGAIAAILIAAGGAAVGAIILGGKNETDNGGGVIVVSPVQ